MKLRFRVVALAALGAWLAWPSSKRLEFRYTSKVSVVSFDQAAPRELRLVYGDQVVKSPMILTARIVNTGGEEILAEDVEEAPHLLIDRAKLLNATIAAKDPEDLNIRCERDGGSIRFPLGVLNPGDSATINILCDGDPGWPALRCRISGLRRPSTLLPGTPGATNLSILVVYDLFASILCALAPLSIWFGPAAPSVPNDSSPSS